MYLRALQYIEKLFIPLVLYLGSPKKASPVLGQPQHSDPALPFGKNLISLLWVKKNPNGEWIKLFLNRNISSPDPKPDWASHWTRVWVLQHSISRYKLRVTACRAFLFLTEFQINQFKSTILPFLMYYKITLPSEHVWHKSKGLIYQFINFPSINFPLCNHLWSSGSAFTFPAFCGNLKVACLWACVFDTRVIPLFPMEMLFIQIWFYLRLVYVHLAQSRKSKCKRSQTMREVRLRFWMEQEIIPWFLSCHFILGTGSKIGIVGNT